MAATSESLRKNRVKRTTVDQRNASKSVATPAIHTVSKMVELLKPYELNDSNRFTTYQLMLQDEAITSSVDQRITAIEVAQSTPKFKYNKNSEKSVYIKRYLEYCLRNMKQSPRQIGRNCAELVYNGISLHEIVSKIDSTGGEFDGMFVLDDLVYIDPLTLDKIKPFISSDSGRKIIAWRQLISAFKDTSGLLSSIQGNVGAVEIDARKVALISYSASSSRPLGSSALDAVYTLWREKQLLSELLLASATKDLAGTPVLRIPLSLIEQANDPNSDAYRTVQQLTEHMTNLHSGDSTFCILPSSLAEGSSTIPEYDISFKGIDGQGRMFNLLDIIESKRKAIFNVLGASHLLTGENGGGSYNLYEGAANTSTFYSKRDNMLIEDMWNKQIIPLLLKLNNISIDSEDDRVTYVSSEIQPISLSEYGQFVMRTMRLLPAIPDVGNALLERMGVEYRIPDEVTPEEYREMLFEFSDPSKVGTSEGSSGQGGNIQQNSDINGENS